VRLVIQRVSRASVRVGRLVVASIGPGLLVLAAAGQDERDGEVEWLARKVANLRIFEDDDGKMNRSVLEVAGEVLVVPQFTLYGDATKGRRPSWAAAAAPEVARDRVERFAEALERQGVPVRRGAFQEHMEVELVNDGPVTIPLESPASVGR
jgi:D-tyrosyl-tRNA(Tyr) deacylase